MASAALLQGQVSPRVELRGRRSTFARSSIEFVAGAALSQGQVQNSCQAQHFRKVKCRIRGRCSLFAGSSKDSVARAALSQGQLSKIATFKYESSTRSPLSQLGLENRNF